MTEEVEIEKKIKVEVKSQIFELTEIEVIALKVKLEESLNVNLDWSAFIS